MAQAAFLMDQEGHASNLQKEDLYLVACRKDMWALRPWAYSFITQVSTLFFKLPQ